MDLLAQKRKARVPSQRLRRRQHHQRRRLHSTTGQWYHVAVTRSGNTYKFYVDGVQNGTDRFDSNTMPNASAPLTLGKAEALTALQRPAR